ncbi:MAG TPA: c-type cytochrome [Chromatiaceae bacterium]|nr:c-type cytochrome [Chromatiaceae bacterium]
MTSHKTLIATAGIMCIALSSGVSAALDGAGLYRERTCIACHGADGREPVMSDYPKIAGQKAPYLLAQMKKIKDGTRSNDSSIAMKNVMHLISEDEMAVVAEWLAGLPR